MAIHTAEEFARLLEALANDVVYANAHWKHANDLNKALAESPQVWAQSRTFWHLTLNANRYTALQSLSRAYDQDQRSLHLLSWLNIIKENSHLFTEQERRRRLAGNSFVDSLVEGISAPDPQVLDQDIALCSSKDPDVARLIRYRSNLLAHRNAKSTITGADRNGAHALPGTNIERLLDRATVILNRYSNLFSASVHSINMIGHDDYKYVVSAVQDAVDRSNDDLKMYLTPESG